MALRHVRSVVETRRLRHVRFWLDDLAEIDRLISEVTGEDKILIVDSGEYAIDRVMDLADYPEMRMKSLVIQSADERISLKLSAREARLDLLTPSLAAAGMAQEVERIAERRRRRIASGRKALIIFAICSAYFAVFGYLQLPHLFSATAGLDMPEWTWYVALAGAAITACATAVLLAVRILTGTAGTKDGAILIPRTRKDAPTWYQRNKDGLTQNIVVSAIFLVLGILIGRILQK